MLVDQVKISFKWELFRYFSTGLVVMLLLTSCFREKAPEEVLSEEEMVRVLTEIYIAEEKAGLAGVPYDSLKGLFPKFSVKVFEKTGVAESTFRQSMEYYLAEPEKLENIYTALIDSLNLKAQGGGVKEDHELPK